MMNWLASNGNVCTVITSFPYYPHWSIQKPYHNNFFRYKKEIIKNADSNINPITIYRCPQYVPKKPTKSKRMLMNATFFVSAFLLICYFLFKKNYKYIICVAPSFEVGLLAILYKKLKGGKFLYHIQDLQIEAAKEFHMIKSSLLIKSLLRIEKFILKKADTVSSISDGMIEKIREKHNRNIFFFPNWVDTQMLYPILPKEDLKKQFGFEAKDKIILYSGAIGEKQGLESIVRVANNFSDAKDLKFVICGSGPYKSALKELSDSLKLNNIYFLPLQPFEKLNSFLNMADIHLVLLKANSSNLVMPSKLAPIFSVGGTVIISALEDSSLYKLVSTNNLGILVDPENDCDLIRAINVAMNEDISPLRNNARNYAKKYLSLEKVLSNFSENLIFS
jgi:colanic acid biosynthesis glycosyl transferase WcaI